ncbi:uncharacterized protein LOC124372121 isoform X1 [Homalodisca vitripennis]|uniref:Uncharacterized protein n=1 Tax=Homalodisca liturata TaxID=320908 RepID=A0A1B6JXT9_9HEMI|nr:uncharacterized protein LOC124372121 isoform X1 [Homalodisca vitripennis]XP_046686452.1 uncharacterized protein LOC124372121 isoform X1 [Homalodisca vitripennis]
MEGKNRLDELQEKLSESLADINQKRKDMPQKCTNILEKNLQLQQLQSEKIIILPKTGVKKLTCKYSTDVPLNVSFKLPEAKMNVNELHAFISQINEEQKNLLKVIEMCKKHNTPQS